jgi:hypothetical protein
MGATGGRPGPTAALYRMVQGAARSYERSAVPLQNSIFFFGRFCDSHDLFRILAP